MKRYYIFLSTFIFAVVGLLHLIRAIMGTEVTINGWLLPVWISWLGFTLTAFLAAWGAASLIKNSRH